MIGDALLDSYLEGEAARLSRDGPIPVVRKTTEQRLPERAANVAANLQALAAEYIAITLAEHGVFLLDRHGHAIHLPAHPVAVAHDVGAPGGGRSSS